MGWGKKLIGFWKNNLERNFKRISIALGAFIIVVMSTCMLPMEQFLVALYSGGLTCGSIVVMSIFGKNGNGHEEEKDD